MYLMYIVISIPPIIIYSFWPPLIVVLVHENVHCQIKGLGTIVAIFVRHLDLPTTKWHGFTSVKVHNNMLDLGLKLLGFVCFFTFKNNTVILGINTL